MQSFPEQTADDGAGANTVRALSKCDVNRSGFPYGVQMPLLDRDPWISAWCTLSQVCNRLPYRLPSFVWNLMWMFGRASRGCRYLEDERDPKVLASNCAWSACCMAGLEQSTLALAVHRAQLHLLWERLPRVFHLHRAVFAGWLTGDGLCQTEGRWAFWPLRSKPDALLTFQLYAGWWIKMQLPRWLLVLSSAVRISYVSIVLLHSTPLPLVSSKRESWRPPGSGVRFQTPLWYLTLNARICRMGKRHIRWGLPYMFSSWGQE